MPPKPDARALAIRKRFYAPRWDAANRMWFGRCRECSAQVCADYEADVPTLCDVCAA